ncbi:MAG TPA: hypothetical protein VGH04_09025 [Gemmatimonadaceae bacterium]|jgi:hypothetical protein
MSEEGLSPDQRRDIEALMTDLEAQSVRVGVDLRTAMGDMNEIEAPRQSAIESDESGESFTESFTIDVSGIVKTLRALPDGAGTSAFVAAYNRTHPDWRDRPSNER